MSISKNDVVMLQVMKEVFLESPTYTAILITSDLHQL